ncbi:S-layer homology domain-containing protein [Candidatus Peregrinibacteria bacterium]|nr:MAG: S-layer homology domain-containing protein [Candidatus Peregrinibacteria bacterium]
MKKLKFLILVTVATSLLANSLTGVRSSTDSNLDEANVEFKYVFTDGDQARNVSDEAEDNDGQTFVAFDDQDEDTQYLYLGSEDPFNEAIFLIEEGIEVDADEDLDITWEYSTSSDWRTLELDRDEVDEFDDDGTFKIEFDPASSWRETEVEDKEAYWIRVKIEGEVDQGVTIDQISGVAYNISVTVTDQNGNFLTDLDEDNFRLYDISDDKIYEWTNNGKGEYEFAVNNENDDSFLFVVDVKDYSEYGINVVEFSGEALAYKIQLTLDTGCNAPFVDLDYHWAQTAVELLYCRGIIEGEGSNLYGVNHSVTRAEFLKMAMMNADINTSRYENVNIPYGDVDEDEWYYEYVAAAYRMDVIDGAHAYFPEGEISRVEALTILVRMTGMEGDKSATRFSDVKASEWYAATVRLATDYEVVEGYPDGTFKPDRKLSRSEAAMMTNNAYNAWYQN